MQLGELCRTSSNYHVLHSVVLVIVFSAEGVDVQDARFKVSWMLMVSRINALERQVADLSI